MSELLRFQYENIQRRQEEERLEAARYDCSLLRRNRGIFHSAEENIQHQEEKRLMKEDDEIALINRRIEERKDYFRKTAKFSKLYNSKGREIQCYTGESMVSWYLMDRGSLTDIVNDNYAWGRISHNEMDLFMRVADLFFEF